MWITLGDNSKNGIATSKSTSRDFMNKGIRSSIIKLIEQLSQHFYISFLGNLNEEFIFFK
jgi:hypothetical protein